MRGPSATLCPLADHECHGQHARSLGAELPQQQNEGGAAQHLSGLAVAKSGVTRRDAIVPTAVTQSLLARDGPAKDPCAPAALFFLPRGEDPRAPAGAAEAPRASTSRFSLCRLCSTSSAPSRCMSVREPCMGF